MPNKTRTSGILREMEMKNISGLPAEKIDTLLFDLDGTIIDMNRRAEIIFYFRAFRRFKPYFNPVSFFISFRKSVRAILDNHTESLNYDVFIENMARFGRTTPQVIDALTSELIKQDFQPLEPFFRPVPGGREAVHLANELGYRLVLVTNPVFPMTTVLYRLKWAGLMPDNFLFMTHSQNMNRCKPGLEFYDKLLMRLALAPERCLMIGNTDEDLPAHDIGIRTFLVETPLSKKSIRNLVSDQRLDARGPYADLINWMKNGRCKAA
jgi:FMN phosphatase YigB (HAD superfamily)